MKPLKVLNLYPGIGGNRKKWENVDVVAVELDEQIAAVYKKLFPGDVVIIGDAHEYLLKNYMKFDFIWASPPCPTHSDIRRCGVHKGQNLAVYPDMNLYQEIILLKYFAPKKTKWVVENVKPYYPPLIHPDREIHRHIFWSNFYFSKNSEFDKDRKHVKIREGSTVYGFNIKGTEIENKRKVLRNMVDPDLGLHILNAARGIIKKQNTEQLKLI